MMIAMTLTILLVAAAAVAYQAYVTARVVKSACFGTANKAILVLLVWLWPVVAAAVVHAFLISDDEIPVRQDKNFIPGPGNDGAG